MAERGHFLTISRAWSHIRISPIKLYASTYNSLHTISGGVEPLEFIQELVRETMKTKVRNYGSQYSKPPPFSLAIPLYLSSHSLRGIKTRENVNS